MNFSRKLLLGLTGISLAFAPISSLAAESTSDLSVVEYQQARNGAEMTDENQLNGNHTLGLIMLAVVAAGMVYVLYEIISDDGNDQPTSP